MTQHATPSHHLNSQLQLPQPPGRTRMNVQLPPIDYHNPEWRWPSWKFGLHMRVLFEDLYQKYNMEPSPIQQAEAFHHDVYEIANRASSPEEFYRLLGERKKQRLEELRNAFNKVAIAITGHPALTSHIPNLWESTARFTHHRTLDYLVEHFASFIPDGYFEEQQQLIDRNSAKLAKLMGKPYRGIDADGKRVDGSSDPFEKPDLPHLPTWPLPPMPPQGSSGPKEHPPKQQPPIPSPPRSSSDSENLSPEQQLPITPPPQLPPPCPAARMRDVGTQTMEGRVTKRKPAALRRTGGAAIPRKSARVAAQAEESVGGGGGGSRYNLRSKQGAGTTGRTREQRGEITRGRRQRTRA
ncbi:hypothetical protein RB594_008181 [Gaeumannomyces avenae]